MQVKLYRGKTKTVASETVKLLQRGGGEGQYRFDFGKGGICAIKYIFFFLVDSLCQSHESSASHEKPSSPWRILVYCYMKRYKKWAYKITSWEYLPEDLSCQFPASPDYRVPYFCSPSWAPLRGCWRLTATAAHDLILVEVDGKCPWQVSVCNWHGTRDHLVHNAWLMVREHTVNTNFLAPVSLGLCVHDHQVVNFFLWWRF